MKFMVQYSIRNAGLTAEQNIANGEALVAAFGRWKPEDGLKVHAFLGKLGGAGGYALIEAEDPKAVIGFASKFAYWNDIEVVPVIEIGDAVAAGMAAQAWTREAMRA